MDMTTESAFISALASASPTPGGGGAAALVGAIGTALGNMVGALTVGKKKYAAVEEEMLALRETCTALQAELLSQVEADAQGFAPLAKAYAIPKDDPAREAVLEEALYHACLVPLHIMELCGEALRCLEQLGEKGSRLAVSDAGCGAVCCKAAMQAASLNVFINTKSMKNRAVAEELNGKATALLAVFCPMADSIFAAVKDSVS